MRFSLDFLALLVNQRRQFHCFLCLCFTTFATSICLLDVLYWRCLYFSDTRRKKKQQQLSNLTFLAPRYQRVLNNLYCCCGEYEFRSSIWNKDGKSSGASSHQSRWNSLRHRLHLKHSPSSPSTSLPLCVRATVEISITTGCVYLEAAYIHYLSYHTALFYHQHPSRRNTLKELFINNSFIHPSETWVRERWQPAGTAYLLCLEQLCCSHTQFNIHK